MQKRTPKGVPAGGRFSTSVHDAAAPLEMSTTEQMDAIRGDSSRDTEFSKLALENTAEALREFSPSTTRLRMIDTRHRFRALGLYDDDGGRQHITDAEFAEVQRRLDDASPVLCERSGLVSKVDDPEGRGRGFFYELGTSERSSAGARELVGV